MSKLVSTQFIPGLPKSGIYTPMIAAVIKYRQLQNSHETFNVNQCMRQMSIQPDEYGYGIEAAHKLKNFQTIGIFNAREILEQYKGVIIADDMGLGKTIEGIVLSEVMNMKTLLIVVESKTMIQWRAQYYKWTGKILSIPTTKKEAIAWDVTQHPFTLVSYDLLDSLIKSRPVGMGASWDMVIYDEVQKLRSRSTKMSLAGREIRKHHTRYVVALTGTLQWGYRRDSWNPLNCIFGYAFGSADDFDFTYCGAYINEHGGKVNEGYKSTDGIDRSVEYDIRLSHVSIRRTRQDVKAELPAFTRNVVRIPCTEKATIALHAFLRKELPYMNAIMSTTNEKTEPVLELLETLPNAIIFTWTNKDVSLLTARIMQQGKTVYAITGKTKKEERVAIISRAATEKATIVATIDSCGVGVDGLQHVSPNAIFHSLSHSGKLHLQAEARVFRMGQDTPVIVTYFVMQDSADELVISILEAKSNQDGQASASDKQTFTGLKMDDANMQAVLDEWVKTATDEIDMGLESKDGWTDTDDEED